MKISPSCYAVTGLAYSAPWFVNAGFIAGSEATLIVDTGGNAMAAATIHGYATAVRPANRLLAVNTERHFDHILGNDYLASRGVEIWAHPGVQRTEAEFAAEIAEYNDAIANPIRRERREGQVFFTETRLAMPRHAVTPATKFNLGGITAEVLFTPGHTPSNISIWVASEGVLYAGDCLINGYIPNLEAGGPAHWLAWLDSLDLIAQLTATAVVAGHGPVAKGGAVTRIIAEVRRTLEDALERGVAPTAEPPAAG